MPCWIAPAIAASMSARIDTIDEARATGVVSHEQDQRPSSSRLPVTDAAGIEFCMATRTPPVHTEDGQNRSIRNGGLPRPIEPVVAPQTLPRLNPPMIKQAIAVDLMSRSPRKQRSVSV